MQITAIKTRIFKQGQNLLAFVCNYLGKPGKKAKIKNGDVLVITSKIVALAENRVAEIKDAKTREKIIKAESQFAMRTKYTWLTIKDSMVLSSAGVDESNADGKLILLPKDSYAVAEKIRKDLKKIYQLKNLGVIITDSRLLPLRSGVVGIALGYSGFKGILDYRGMPDIFGRKMKLSKADLADSLATAAVLLMGESNQQRPLAIISNSPAEFTEKINRGELHIDPTEDLYQPLFEKIKKIKYKKVGFLVNKSKGKIKKRK